MPLVPGQMGTTETTRKEVSMLSSLKPGCFFLHEREVYAFISKHGNGFALVRRISNRAGEYVECPVEHLDLDTNVEEVRAWRAG
jgi:hypothetical protein